MSGESTDGVQRVCRVWHWAPACMRGAASQAPCSPRRSAPPQITLVAHVRRVLEASPFHGEGYRKVWAKLRVEGLARRSGCGG